MICILLSEMWLLFESVFQDVTDRNMKGLGSDPNIVSEMHISFENYKSQQLSRVLNCEFPRLI